MAASTPITFDSKVDLLNSFRADWSQDEIKNEPMFFNSSVDFAYANGGPITRGFITALPAEFQDVAVFDSRVHMLMPGWYPAIPGWHHDDVPRAVIPPGQHFMTAGQPDYDAPRYKARHIMGLVNGDVCPTAFALGTCVMPAVPDGLIYRAWHPIVQALVDDGYMQQFVAPNGLLIGFDWQTFHTGQKSSKTGWRWFGRVSINTERCKQITNEIRRQVQVYLEFPMEGW